MLKIKLNHKIYPIFRTSLKSQTRRTSSPQARHAVTARPLGSRVVPTR
jgi:hypothetical protein